MNSLESISLRDSMLFGKVYRSRKALLSHLAEYLKEEDSRISVIQFEGHTPTIQAVGEDLRLLSWVPAFEKGEEFRQTNPIYLVTMHEHDWFLEALSGAAAAVAIYEFLIKRFQGKLPMRTERVKERVRQTRPSYRTVTRQVTRTVGTQQFVQQIAQPMLYQEEYFEEIEQVRQIEVDSVGGISIVEIDKMVKRVRRLEVYSNSGEVLAAEFQREE